MPSVCTTVHNNFSMALDVIAPADGSTNLLPPLLSDMEVEEYRLRAVDQIDDYYGDCDPNSQDSGSTRLQNLFQEYLKNFLR